MPFDLSNRTPAEAAQIVVEREPAKPSLYGSVATRHSIWADLDVLCLTAMHKDPQRRYRSVEALIRDIDHFLNGEPLEACPDSLAYRVGKFVGRHRRALSAAVLVLAVKYRYLPFLSNLANCASLMPSEI